VEQAEEKQQTHITAELVETILLNETEVKEKTNTTKDIFEKFKEKLKKA
jgi:hypothetical protein